MMDHLHLQTVTKKIFIFKPRKVFKPKNPEKTNQKTPHFSVTILCYIICFLEQEQ